VNATRIEQARAASDELVAAMARLLPQLGEVQPPDRRELDELIAAPATTLLVARDGERIVGTLTLTVYRTPTKLRAWIDDVVVDRGARGAGVGAALVEEALRLAARRGAARVDLTTRPARAEANRLYRRLGFERRETNVYARRLDRPA
jgi:ribosomal protein S18 acetylase RimI-like enzyme